MERFYRRYARVATLGFFRVAAYTLPAKLRHGHLANHWFHSPLHLGSGVLGA